VRALERDVGGDGGGQIHVDEQHRGLGHDVLVAMVVHALGIGA